MNIEEEDLVIAQEQFEADRQKFRQVVSFALPLLRQGAIAPSDQPALEMFGHDLGVDVASVEGLKDMAVKAATQLRQSFGAFMEKLGIWFDSTGRKEILYLRKRVEEIQSEAVQKTIADRKLADQMSIDGRPVSDASKIFSDLQTIVNAFMDEYVPDLINRDLAVWDELVHSGAIDVHWGDPEKIGDALEKIIAKLVRGSIPELHLTGDGTDRVIGDRSVFYKSRGHRPTNPSRLTDVDTRKLNELIEKEDRHLRGVGDLVRGVGVSRVGVLDVLTPAAMNEALDAMSSICDLIERTIAIRKQGGRDRKQANELRALIEYFDDSEIIEVVESNGQTRQVEVTTLDRVDRQRIELALTFLNMDVNNSVDIIRSVMALQEGVWKSLRSYVKASLKHYR